MFYFDGASNVQKAGQVLMAKYPHTFCYYGGEHVVAPFITSLAKIKPIREIYLDICLIIDSHVTYLTLFLKDSYSKNMQDVQCVWIRR